MKRRLKKWGIKDIIDNLDLILIEGENLSISEYGIIVGDGKSSIKTLLQKNTKTMRLINKETKQLLTETDNPKSYLATHYNFTLIEMHENKRGTEIEVSFYDGDDVKSEIWEVC